MKRSGVIILLILIILIIPLISAGFFENIKKTFTGEATSGPVVMNISVMSGSPVIWNMLIPSAVTMLDGPASTFIVINFSVNDSDGAANLLNTSAMINISKAGEIVRYNSSCGILNYGGYQANFSCNITTYWFDGAGDWVVSANISDLNGHVTSNTTKSITLNPTTSFTMSPNALNFTILTPGTYNQTPVNHLTLNNTGNVNIAGIQTNATDLRGETNSAYALYAANFSTSIYTGGAIECNITASATSLVNMTFTNLTTGVLPKGNYTINNGATGQEKTYYCLREVGSELTQQYYSTANLGSWTVKIA